MSISPPTACRNASSGCPGYAVERGLCSGCLAQSKPTAVAASDPTSHLRWKPYVKGERSEHDRLMATSQWKNRTAPTCKSCNPICQRIIDGVRCTRPSKEVHHLSADLKRFYDPSNLVALCAEDHPKTQGEPEAPREYAPTRWIFGAVYEHPKPSNPKQGEVTIGENGVAR
jgi:hypothetical protein